MKIALLFLLLSLKSFASSLETEVPSPWKFKALNHLLMSQSSEVDIPENDNRAMNEAKLLAEVGSWSFQVGGTSKYSSFEPKSNRLLTLEKYSVQWQSSRWKMRAGDSYLQLGQGIALSLFRDPVLGVSTLR